MPKRQPRQLEATKRFIRNFLRINNSREFLVFLFFLLVAFIFWYLTTMTGEYEMEYSPKLRLKNVPDGILVVEPLPEQFDIVLRDKGDKLVEYKARGKFKELVIDYRHYTHTQGHTAIYGKELYKLIASHLSSSTQVVSMSLDTLQYYVAPSRGVKVPVRAKGRIEADGQYGIHRINMTPDSVTVYAAPSYTDSLKVVYTPEVHYVELTDSVSKTLTLNTCRGVKYVPSEVQLHVAVSPYVTKSVEIPISGYLFPYGVSLKTFPSKAKVSFRISLEDYAKVTEKDFALQVHYAQIQDNPSGKVALRLETHSDNVYNIKVEPAEVDYLLEANAFQ
ncbi:MAG: hypothetical protein IKK87_07210 [Bacteroidaceae bacterium]|nr:hypothetical protein [Bacteroidaceae bacterium]